MKAEKCPRDGFPLGPGIALKMTPTYMESWTYGTVSMPLGFPRLVNCLKCPKCGYSKTI